MWGGTLLVREEFPTMNATYLPCSKGSYGNELRNILPRDIVLCDWNDTDQQSGFPSLSALQMEGLRFVTATRGKAEMIINFNS